MPGGVKDDSKVLAWVTARMELPFAEISVQNRGFLTAGPAEQWEIWGTLESRQRQNQKSASVTVFQGRTSVPGREADKKQGTGIWAGYHGILAPRNQTRVQLSELRHKANVVTRSQITECEAASVPLPRTGPGPRDGDRRARQGSRGPGAWERRLPPQKPEARHTWLHLHPQPHLRVMSVYYRLILDLSQEQATRPITLWKIQLCKIPSPSKRRPHFAHFRDLHGKEEKAGPRRRRVRGASFPVDCKTKARSVLEARRRHLELPPPPCCWKRKQPQGATAHTGGEEAALRLWCGGPAGWPLHSEVQG